MLMFFLGRFGATQLVVLLGVALTASAEDGSTPPAICSAAKEGFCMPKAAVMRGWEPRFFSQDDCCAACFLQYPQGCSAWTFDRDLKTCMLHTQNTHGLLVKGNCISGDVRSAPPEPKPVPRPPGAMNVLFIIVDDFRPEAGVYGQEYMHTPNLDRLGKNATVFKRAYCQQAICGPTRSSFMTGRRPQRTRDWNFQNSFREVGPDWITFPQYFKLHGYTTLGTGKTFHMGLPSDFDVPLSWSHEEEYYFAPFAYPSCEEWPNSVVCPRDGELDTFTDWLNMNRTRRQIHSYAKDSQPFFLAFGAHRPHLPLHIPRVFWDLYDQKNIALPKHEEAPKGMPPLAFTYECDGKTEMVALDKKAKIPYPAASTKLPENMTLTLRRGYYAAVSWVDHLIGELLDALEENGVSQNTIVALIGDHGWQLGEHNIWGKHTNFELANRVPLIIKVPGQKPGVSEALVESVDLFPTVAAAAGLPPPTDLDGMDLSPLIADSSKELKEAAYSEYPRCFHNLSTPWDSTGSCGAIDRKNFTVMGYSIRVSGWRYTAWMRWDAARLQGAFEELPIAEELYAHIGDSEDDFDAFENENVVRDPANNDVVRQLFSKVRIHWDMHPRPTNCTAANFKHGIEYISSGSAPTRPGLSPADCCSKCAEVEECSFFSFSRSENRCFFHAEIRESRQSADFISGAQGNSTGAVCDLEKDIEYEGEELSISPGSGSEDCCKKCATTPGCGHFSFKRSSRTCHFKSSVSRKRKNSDAISGGNVSASCSGPRPAQGLALSPEHRQQFELWQEDMESFLI